MAAAGLRDHIVGKRCRVVGADQAEIVRRREGEVDERLVQLALGQLGGGSVGPDRLADAAHPASGAGIVGNEPAPGRDDARRVAPDHLHVDQVNIRGATAERGPQELELARADHHQDRLAALETAMNESQRAVDELIVAVVKNGFMMKGRGTGHSGVHDWVIPM